MRASFSHWLGEYVKKKRCTGTRRKQGFCLSTVLRGSKASLLCAWIVRLPAEGEGVNKGGGKRDRCTRCTRVGTDSTVR